MIIQAVKLCFLVLLFAFVGSLEGKAATIIHEVPFDKKVKIVLTTTTQFADATIKINGITRHFIDRKLTLKRKKYTSLSIETREKMPIYFNYKKRFLGICFYTMGRESLLWDIVDEMNYCCKYISNGKYSCIKKPNCTSRSCCSNELFKYGYKLDSNKGKIKELKATIIGKDMDVGYKAVIATTNGMLMKNFFEWIVVPESFNDTNSYQQRNNGDIKIVYNKNFPARLYIHTNCCFFLSDSLSIYFDNKNDTALNPIALAHELLHVKGVKDHSINVSYPIGTYFRPFVQGSMIDMRDTDFEDSAKIIVLPIEKIKDNTNGIRL